MRYVILFLFAGLISMHLQAQTETTVSRKVNKEKDWSIRGNWNYQFFSFSGKRTQSSMFGGSIEKRINYEATMGLGVNYGTRMEEGSVQNENVPRYNEFIHFSPYIRKYFDKALTGPYTAFAIGLGIPKEQGTQWDFGGHFGYALLSNNLLIDFNVQLGFGSFRYSEKRYDNLGLYLGEYKYVDYGFFFRPGISIGFAL